MKTLIIIESDAECERLLVENNQMFGEHVLEGAHREHMVFKAAQGIVIMTKFTGYPDAADNGYRGFLLSADTSQEELREVFGMVRDHGWNGEPGVVVEIEPPKTVNQ